MAGGESPRRYLQESLDALRPSAGSDGQLAVQNDDRRVEVSGPYMIQPKRSAVAKATGEGVDTKSDVIAGKCIYSVDPAVQEIFTATRGSD